MSGRSDVELQVAINGVHVKSVIATSFFFDTSYGLREVTPGFAQIGSVVTLVGQDVMDGALYKCAFGSVIVDANRPCSNGHIECTVPILPSSNVTLQITANGQDRSNGVSIHVLPSFVNLTSTSVDNVVVASTGAAVLFQGIDLELHRRDIRCSLQLTRLSCVSPPKAEGFSMVNDFTLPATTLAAVQLEHIATPVVSSIYPSSAHRAGGTVITVTGSGFMKSTQYDPTTCLFQSSSTVYESVTASVASDSELICTTPVVHAGHYEQVIMSVFTAPGSPARSSFDFTYDISATSFDTSVTTRGVIVNVVVQGVYWASTDTTDVWCRLGDVFVKASVDTVQSTVSCAAPGGITGPTPIDISLSGQHFSSTSSLLNLQFPELQVHNISAVACGSSDHCILPIGSVVPMMVEVAAPSEMISCRLDRTSALAHVLSNGKWSCALDIAANTAEGFNQVEWTSSESSDKSHEIVTSQMISAAVETVKAAEITTVTPTAAAVTGGTILTLSGKNFHDGMMCDFGGVQSTAISTQSTAEASCMVPASIRGLTQLEITDSLTSTINFVFEQSLVVEMAAESNVVAGGQVTLVTSAPFSHCLFGSVLVEASQYDSAQHCVVPFLRPGHTSLSVSNANTQLFVSAGPITVLSTANVSAVSSQRLTAGNTHDVALSGSGLTLVAPIGCATSAAASLESIPSRMATSGMLYTCKVLPGITSGFVSVDLSVSGMAEYTHSRLQIERIESATLTMIQPTQGSANGKTPSPVCIVPLQSDV